MRSRRMDRKRVPSRSAVRFLAVMAGLFAWVTPVFAGSPEITLPTGTSLELVMVDRLGTRSAKVGDAFRAKLVRALYVDGQPALPKDSVAEGRVVLCKSPREGAVSGVIGVEFVSVRPPGGKKIPIHGKLTSLRQDDRRKMVELAPKVSTGSHIDVVFIGHTTAGHVSTLVGNDLAEDWSHSGLSATNVEIAAGTRVAMEIAEPLTATSVAMAVVAPSDVQYIYVAPSIVTKAQQALSERKYYNGEADGRLLFATRNAIVRFQLENDQVATGDLDEGTLRLLGVDLPGR